MFSNFCLDKCEYWDVVILFVICILQQNNTTEALIEKETKNWIVFVHISVYPGLESGPTKNGATNEMGLHCYAKKKQQYIKRRPKLLLFSQSNQQNRKT